MATLQLVSTQNLWLGARVIQGIFTWVDGTEANFVEPWIESDTDGCVFSSPEGWQAGDCSTQNQYMCKKPLGMHCGESTYAVTTRRVNAAQAQESCVNWGGNLVSILSDTEGRFVQLLLNHNQIADAWIGLHTIWEGRWQWEDGKETFDSNSWQNTEAICIDDEVRLATDSQGKLSNCAENRQYCNDDSALKRIGAPAGWFLHMCPKTCGTCSGMCINVGNACLPATQTLVHSGEKLSGVPLCAKVTTTIHLCSLLHKSV